MLEDQLKTIADSLDRIESKFDLLLGKLSYFTSLNTFTPEEKLHQKIINYCGLTVHGNTAVDDPDNPALLCTLADVSNLTGIPKKTLYNYFSPRSEYNPLGFYPIRKNTKKKYFRISDVEKFINSGAVK